MREQMLTRDVGRRRQSKGKKLGHPHPGPSPEDETTGYFQDGWMEKGRSLLYAPIHVVFVFKAHATTTSQYSSLPKYTRTWQRTLWSRKLFPTQHAPHESTHSNALQPCPVARMQCPGLKFALYTSTKKKPERVFPTPNYIPRQGQLVTFQRAAQTLPRGKGPERREVSVALVLLSLWISFTHKCTYKLPSSRALTVPSLAGSHTRCHSPAARGAIRPPRHPYTCPSD